jgi:septal ring factor EnvC (AmiA/AmiB activator)
MAKLKQDLQAVTRELKALIKKTERLMKAVDKLEKAKAAKKPKAKTRAKAKPARKVVAKKAMAKKKAPAKKESVKETATDQVLKIIKRSKKGVDVPALMKKTGFGEKKVRNIVARAFSQKKIKRTARGAYGGA